MASTLTLLGGVNTIGGNQFLFESERKRFFIDYGIAPDVLDNFYEAPFGRPLHKDILYEMIRLKVLWYFPGLFRQDLSKYSGLTVHEKPLIDYIFLTHAHLDHDQGVPLTDHRIPVGCNEETFWMLKAREEISQGNILNRTVKYSEIREDADEEKIIRTALERKIQRFDKKYDDIRFSYIPRVSNKGPTLKRTFDIGTRFELENTIVEGLKTDHMFGSQAYIVTTPDSTIFCSGDIRMHGPNAKDTERTLEKVASMDIDYALVEGTRIDETERVTEEDLKNKSIEIIKNFSEKNPHKHLFVNSSYTDLARLQLFKEVAEIFGRRLVVPPRVAYYYLTLDDNIPHLSWGIDSYRRKRGTDLDIAFGTKTWRNQKFRKIRVVEDLEIAKNPDDYLIMLSPDQKNKLLDYRIEPGSLVLYTATPPWDEESRISENRILNYLFELNLKVEKIHVSHHAPQQDIVHIVKTIHPKNLIPTHTNHPEEFKRIFGNMTNLIILKEGTSIDLSTDRIRLIERTEPVQVFLDTYSQNVPVSQIQGIKRGIKVKKRTERPKDIQSLYKFFPRGWKKKDITQSTTNNSS